MGMDERVDHSVKHNGSDLHLCPVPVPIIGTGGEFCRLAGRIRREGTWGVGEQRRRGAWPPGPFTAKACQRPVFGSAAGTGAARCRTTG